MANCIVAALLFICSQPGIGREAETKPLPTKEIVNNLAQQIVKNRLAITQLQLAIHGTVSESKKGVVKTRGSDCNYWLDGEKARWDFTWSGVVPAAGIRQIAAFNIEKDGYAFTGSSEADVANRFFLITQGKGPNAGKPTISKIDYRNLGLFNCGFGLLGKFDLATFLVGDQFRDAVLKKTEYQGKEALSLDWTRPNKVVSRVVFLPKNENEVVLVEDRDGDLIHSTKSEYEFFAKCGKYFPTKITHINKIKEVPFYTEEIHINVQAINEPISGGAFTFDGLGLPEGSLIMDYSNPDDPGRTFKKIVDGKAVDAKPNPPTDPKPKAQPIPIQGKPGGGLWNLAYIAAGVASLIVGLLALYIVRFRASKS